MYDLLERSGNQSLPNARWLAIADAVIANIRYSKHLKNFACRADPVCQQRRGQEDDNVEERRQRERKGWLR